MKKLLELAKRLEQLAKNAPSKIESNALYLLAYKIRCRLNPEFGKQVISNGD